MQRSGTNIWSGTCTGTSDSGHAAGVLNGRYLGRLVMIARNKKIHKPEFKKLLSKYYQLFSKAGQLVWEQMTLGLAPEEAQECDDE